MLSLINVAVDLIGKHIDEVKAQSGVNDIQRGRAMANIPRSNLNTDGSYSVTAYSPEMGRRLDAESVNSIIKSIPLMNLTKRELFALVAMHAMASNPNMTTEDVAEISVIQADELLGELDKTMHPPKNIPEVQTFSQKTTFEELLNGPRDHKEQALQAQQNLQRQNEDLRNMLNNMNSFSSQFSQFKDRG